MFSNLKTPFNQLQRPQPMNTHQFLCVECEHTQFTLHLDTATFFANCLECETSHQFDAKSDRFVLSHINGALFISCQSQESAATVAAPAPDSGYLSTETVDK